MIGIFLEPNKPLKKIIIKWKKNLKKKNIKGKLINHPPHSTIFFANIRNKKQLFLIIEKTIKEFKKFKVTVNKTDVFKNDLFTGGDTIYLNIKKNRKLLLLQKKIAINLRSLVDKKSKNKRNLKFKNKLLDISQKKYGFPFVGNHWMPHFTIGSIKNFIQMNDYKIFRKLKINLNNEINKITVWKIIGNKHIKLKEIKLGTKN
jgi:2'-5' RNA ligase